MNKELSKEEELAELLMQSESVQSSIFLIKEYAKKEAIAFVNWCEENYRCLGGEHWRDDEMIDIKTTEQLYEIYLTNQQK